MATFYFLFAVVGKGGRGEFWWCISGVIFLDGEFLVDFWLVNFW